MLITNLAEFSKIYKMSRACIDLWGTMALSMFLAMALMSLKIWELLALAGPMILMILMQAVMLMLFAYFITFRVMGKNYNAAIIAGGHCGFGLGATPGKYGSVSVALRSFTTSILSCPFSGRVFY